MPPLTPALTPYRKDGLMLAISTDYDMVKLRLRVTLFSLVGLFDQFDFPRMDRNYFA